MPKTRREFSPEFKREAVALLESSGRPLMQVATEVGISPSMLRNWRAVIRGDALLGQHDQPRAVRGVDSDEIGTVTLAERQVGAASPGGDFTGETGLAPPDEGMRGNDSGRIVGRDQVAAEGLRGKRFLYRGKADAARVLRQADGKPAELCQAAPARAFARRIVAQARDRQEGFGRAGEGIDQLAGFGEVAEIVMPCLWGVRARARR